MGIRKKSGTRKETVLNKAVIQELIHFKDYNSSQRLSRNLRAMLMDFLMTEGGTEAPYLQDLLFDLQGLFALLDVIEEDR